MDICEVGPRDGLQNEDTVLAPAVRAELIDRLAATGLRRVEAVSFVNPRLVPAMADAETVLGAVTRTPGVRYAGLVLNERGLDRALAAGVDEIHYAFPVTDSFAQRNQNTTTEVATQLSGLIVRRAREAGLPVTVTLSTAFGCPFEGEVPAAKVLRVAERVAEEPPDELQIADTIGVGVPSQVRELVAGVKALGMTPGCHFHDTRGTGIANALAAVEAGVRRLDASVGGAGGCPFAPKATGNIATETLVYTLERMGYDTGVDLAALVEVAHWLGEHLGRELPGAVSRADMFPPR